MTTTGAPRPGRRTAARRRDRPPRSPAAVALSVALHGALAVVLAQALRVPAPFMDLFTRLRTERMPERVTFVEPRPGTLPPPQPEGRGGAPPAPAAPRVVAPRSVPDELPRPSPEAAPPLDVSPPSEAAPTAERGGGSGTGGGGALAGLRPTYTGPSAIWSRPTWVHENPATVADRLDSLVAVELVDVRDSLVAESQRRRPGDWTFERDGRKYGMDQSYLHLGRVSIPTALLGLVPLKQQANPIARERAQRLESMGAESRVQARRRQDDVDVKARVAAIRERKDRERAERRARSGASAAGSGPTVPPR